MNIHHYKYSNILLIIKNEKQLHFQSKLYPLLMNHVWDTNTATAAGNVRDGVQSSLRSWCGLFHDVGYFTDAKTTEIHMNLLFLIILKNTIMLEFGHKSNSKKKVTRPVYNTPNEVCDLKKGDSAAG